MLDESVEIRITALQQKIEHRQEDEETDIVIASARYGFISWLTQDLVKKRGQVSNTLSDRIDRVVLSRVFGIPIFVAAMYLMFMFTINLGGAFIDFFEQLTGTIFVDGFTAVLNNLSAPEWMITILAGGIGGGIQTMSTFIRRSASCFSSSLSLKTQGTWPEPPLSWTALCGSSVCRARPLSQCWSVSVAMYRQSWRQERWKTSVTEH